MKNFLLTTIVTLLFALSSSAQVQFGLRGGLNINRFSLDAKVIETNNLKGFYLGPTLLINTSVIDIDVSALYDQRNLEVDGEEINKKGVDLQLNIRRGIGLGENLNLFAFIGPQFTFNLDAKDIKEISECVQDWRWKNSDFSINIGGGFIIMKHLEIKANYNVACGKSAEAKEIIRNYGTLSTTVENMLAPKANAWQIGATYYF